MSIAGGDLDTSMPKPAARLVEAVVRLPSGRTILGPVSLTVAEGEHWVVLGPNGSGKTTLLTLLGAYRQPSSGTVEVLGSRLGRADVRTLRRRIGHVSHAIADRMRPQIPVETVVLTGKQATLEGWLQVFDDADRRRARELLERFGCGELLTQEFGRCSQGERQRVLLARALFGRPGLLLLDEPAAGLDLPGRETLIAAMEEAARDFAEHASVLVTHHLEEIPPSVTHAALLREGAIVESGPIHGVLTDAAVGACFGLAVTVAQRGGRWSVSAVSVSSPSGTLEVDSR
jgi:iron complex transport system ATP-binding protein